MLGREAVDERRRGSSVGQRMTRRCRASSRRRSWRAAVGELAVDFGVDGAREPRIVGDEDRLRGLVVLGLASRSAATKPGRRCVGEHDDFRGAGDHVDADVAEHPPLGRRDVGVAGADDLVDRRDRLVP